MFPAIAKFIGGKVLTAVLVVTSALIVIWYYRLPLEDREALWLTARHVLVWIGFVLVLPWATFFVPIRVVRAESNLASALMLVGYLVVDIAFALYLAGGTVGGTFQAAILILGFLCAALYNFLACEFVADRAEDASP
ncbi:MAG TPA: hypothetical protein PL151_18790 [Phycisphaerae bacterium]|nr:hypothetical protein [Phycisphaerae bacterium]HOJ76193.1 hypothetical protein [Phycisphaerae bacterium]HOM53517.1 hypothetical protein [Phycisphaerae bacterium]HON65213.1 hypothetical protein [Phycisphaerae bacterium]HOQ86640.1 hypothetical protein [Phycisphaerae bacterium]